VPSPPVGVPSGAPKTWRSRLLAVSSSTIKKPSGYIILKIPLFFAITAFLLKRFNILSTAKEIRIKFRTPRWLVPIVVLRIRRLLVTRNWTYQSGVKSGAR
jgi:hypothetical protein